VREGYTALRATGEMTWVLRGPPGAERLIEYEVLLNKFFPGSRCLGLCQYDRRRFAPEFLLDVLRAHPVVVLGTEVCENPFYIPPEELVRDGSAAACLQHWISGLLHNKRAAQRLRESLHDRELLLRELYHRVKNNLQVVSSLLRLQARTVTAPEVRALEESQRRIQAMAMLHNKLYESQELDQVNFGEYLTGLVQAVVRAHQAEGIRVDVEAPEEALPLDLGVAIPCGLVLNELLCNALTHAFPAERTGEVQVAVRRREGGCVELDVRDNGIGLPDHVDPRSSTSFGLQLVQTLVELQLKGDLELVRAAGTEFRIRFPLEGPPRPRERR
jgi:two-component sensor histidine kinase